MELALLVLIARLSGLLLSHTHREMFSFFLSLPGNGQVTGIVSSGLHLCDSRPRAEEVGVIVLSLWVDLVTERVDSWFGHVHPQSGDRDSQTRTW